MKNALVWLILLWLHYLAFSDRAGATELKFDRISLDEGLSQSSVRAIIQDYKGFIWFSTQDGLNRYDGYNFVVYKHDPDKSGSLRSNFSVALLEDRDSTLWVGTTEGLHRYDRATDNFTVFRTNPDNKNSLSNNLVWCFEEDRAGNIWVGTDDGLNRLDKQNGQFERFLQDPANLNSLSDSNIRALMEDDHGRLWVGTQTGGLNMRDPQTGLFKRYQSDPADSSSISDNRVSSLAQDAAGFIWVATANGLNKLDPQTEQFTRYEHDAADPKSLASNDVRTVLVDHNNVLWVGTEGGLCLYRHDTGDFSCYAHEHENPHSLASNSVRALYEDHTGILWIGSLVNGVSKLSASRMRFAHFQYNPHDPGSLSENTVRAFTEDSLGGLWVGTQSGSLNRYEPRLQKFIHYQHDPQNPFSLPGDDIRALYTDRSGNIWVGTLAGLCRYEAGSDRFIRYENKVADPTIAILLNRIWHIREDDAGFIWLGLWGGGLARLNPATGEFINYRHDPQDPQSLSNDWVRIFWWDRAGNFWIGTWGGGLCRMKGEPGSGQSAFENYMPNDHDPGVGPSSRSITSICEDHAGILWLGTIDGGLDRFDPMTRRFHAYTEKNGLCNSSVYGVLEDNLGYLWLSTNHGLTRFDPRQETFVNFDVNDGLQSNEFNNGAYYKSKQGELFFGGVNGFNRFFPETIQQNPFRPHMAITNFQIFNQTVPIGAPDSPLQKAIGETTELALSYRYNVFSFEFAALHYAAPIKHKYAYMLEGFDDDWNYTDARRRFVTYTNLNGGDYVFRVKGSNGDGVWNEDGISLRIKIIPPFWKTWWAYSLAGLFLLTGGWTFYWWRVRHIQRELEQERLIIERMRQVDHLKDEFLANTSHELRTPLNGIIGIVESLIDGATGGLPRTTVANLKMVTASARRLSNLVNDILDFSQLKNRDLILQYKPVDMHALTDVTLTLLQPMIGKKKLELHNDIHPDAPYVYADENRLQQIMLNLVGNAIKFTAAGKIVIKNEELRIKNSSENQFVTPNASFLIFSVSDTGIGIPADKLSVIFQSFEQVDTSITRQYGGTGLGLSVTKQLVDLHGGKIWVESLLDHGSTFYFTLPIFTGVVSERPGDTKAISVELSDSIVADATLTEPASIEAGNETARILIVDDEPINIQALVNQLSLHNYSVTQATNGQEALDALERETFSLILLDVMMPRMSGYEVAQKIRERYSMDELPIILLTAKNQIADIVEGFNSGANDYMTKPFSKNELLSRLKTHLTLLQINAAYQRFVPVEFFKALGKDSIMDVQLGDQTQREMTVVFSDIRGYTTLAEKMTPKENFDFLNGFLKRMGPIILRNNGFVNQYYGDGLMSLFPTTEDGVIAAIGMQREVLEYNKERAERSRQPIKIGIGIHTGPLMLGIIGDEKRMSNGVVADTVNTAARMEGLTKSYGAQIIISEATLAGIAAANPYHIRLLDRVQVKGKEQPLSIYEVYDAEIAEITRLKQETAVAFLEGLHFYQQGDFAEAAAIFAKIAAKNPADRAAPVFMERCHEYQQHGAPADWDGVMRMERK